ncbi:MAG TPA: T9SS type A sorting domain-containing protein [Bacteroidales bacterium]|nr:T9SS type A sorting domain-containing protein [Bacteroidales bacterium]
MKKILFSILLIAINFIANAQIPTNGLVGWWPFSGNVIDSSGTGNNGIIYGATITTDRFGNSNSAYSFNGTDNYIEVPNNSSLNPPSVTVSVWVKINSYSHAGSGNATIESMVFKKNTLYNYFEGYQIRLETSNGIVCSSVASCSGDERGTCNNNITQLNQWSHFLMTANAIEMKFYVNGTLKQSSNTGFQLCFDVLPLYFGRTAQSQFEGFLNGVLDDIRIYNRVLNNSEIIALYLENTAVTVASDSVSCSSAKLISLVNPKDYPANVYFEYGTTTSYGNTINAIPYSISGSSPSSISANITGLLSGTTYHFRVKSVNAFCTTYGEDMMFTTSNQFPAVPLIPTGINSLCQNVLNTNYSTTAVVNTTGYLWHIYPSNAGAISGTSTIGTVDWNNAFSGVAYIKVMAINGSCESSYSDSIMVTVLPAPTATLTPGGVTTFCEGSSVILSSNTGANLFYTWQKNGITISGASNSSYLATQSGSYAVIVANINNCSDTSTVLTVTANPLPVATVTPNGSTTICQGQSVTLNANTGSGLTYQWQKDGVDIIGAIGASLLAAQPGAYTVIVSNSYPCSTTSTAINVTVNPSPAAAITINGNASLCQGDSVLLSTTYIAGLTYQWQKNGVDINGATDTVITVKQAGNYAIIISNSLNCSATDFVTITVNTLPNAQAGSDQTICLGDTVTLVASGGETYAWSDSVVQNVPFIPTGTATYYVTVTTTAGCSAEDNVLVTVNPVPPIPTVTQNGMALLSSSGTGNQWFLNGNPISGATAQLYNATTPGFYQVQVTNSYGCSSISVILSITNIDENSIENGISIYPNPANNYITLEFAQKCIIEISNIQGQLIKILSVIGNQSNIDISTFPSGLYIMKVKTEKGVAVKKFVKE